MAPNDSDYTWDQAMAREKRLPLIRVHWYEFNLTNIEKDVRKKFKNSNLMVENIRCLKHGSLRRTLMAGKGTVKMLFEQAYLIEVLGI